MMTQRQEALAERSLEIVKYDRAVVVKLNWRGWVTNAIAIAAGFGSKGKKKKIRKTYTILSSMLESLALP